jgi:hypothetical protein
MKGSMNRYALAHPVLQGLDSMGDTLVLPLMNDATVPSHVSEPSVEEILYLLSLGLLFHTYSTTSVKAEQKYISLIIKIFSKVENMAFQDNLDLNVDMGHILQKYLNLVFPDTRTPITLNYIKSDL